MPSNQYVVLTNNNNNKEQHERVKKSQFTNFRIYGMQYVTHDRFTEISTMSVSCPGPVDSNGSSTSFLHTSDDNLDLVLWNSVPFTDKRIFQFLQRVEWMIMMKLWVRRKKILLFWTLLKNKLSLQSTFGKNKQVRHVKHPYCTCNWFSARNDSSKTLVYLF